MKKWIYNVLFILCVAVVVYAALKIYNQKEEYKKAETEYEQLQKKEKNIDFGELKKDLRNIADSMDHALIIERNSLKDTTFEALKSENFKIIELDFRPTAENMAKYFYEKIKILGYNMRAVSA